ncbi:MAG: trypsin-like peptidase domain-containing protein [Chloroflexi bacterium]|nr:trypsin-like peptidase domain-containing protein [Chloroflexota bacterium]
MFRLTIRLPNVGTPGMIAGMALTSALLLGACGGGQTETPPQEPTGVTATEAPTRETLQAPSPEPFVDVSETPASTQVSLHEDDELTTVEVVKLLTPSIVQIVTESLSMGLFNQPIPSRGVGTGVIIDTNGHIMTNNHVIAGAQRITATLANGESYPVEFIGGDFQTDLAVVRIDAPDLQPAKLGNSSELEVGEDVIAIGHALGLAGGPTVSKGVVSALGRTIDTDAQNTIVELIQTDAEVNPGNSGGALVNNAAEVVGINTAIIQSARGIGFAINIDDAKVVVQQLIDKGYVERGFMGISPVNVTPGLAERFGFAVKEGIIVTRVISGTAAAREGIRVEDIIVQLGDTPIRNTGELSKFLISHLPGETIDVVFYRGQDRIVVEITLGGRP